MCWLLVLGVRRCGVVDALGALLGKCAASPDDFVLLRVRGSFVRVVSCVRMLCVERRGWRTFLQQGLLVDANDTVAFHC